MGKVDNIKKRSWINVSREIEALRKNQKEILEIRNTITEMKNSFDGHR